MHRAICSNILFSITNSKSPSHLINRYKLGRLVDDTLYLTPFEALFLFAKGRIKPENTFFSNTVNLMKELIPESSDLILYTVYEEMKLKGFYAKRESDALFFRKSPKEEYLGPMKVMRESRHVSFDDLAALSGSLVATVDDENDVTYFRVYDIDPRGKADTNVDGKRETGMVSDRYIAESNSLPDWVGNDFKGVRFLTDLENCLLNRDSTEPVECYSNPLYQIYSDLINRGIIVKTGFKYGTNFRAYTTTMEDHADYLVHYLAGKDEWYKISRAVRVSQGVHKIMIFAGFVASSLTYVAVERIRDPFLQKD